MIAPLFDSSNPEEMVWHTSSPHTLAKWSNTPDFHVYGWKSRISNDSTNSPLIVWEAPQSPTGFADYRIRRL